MYTANSLSSKWL